MSSQPFPSGIYECPKCRNQLEVFVPLKEAPIHRCPPGKRYTTMVYKDESNRRTSAARDSLG
jgi:hypothetical protein